MQQSPSQYVHSDINYQGHNILYPRFSYLPDLFLEIKVVRFNLSFPRFNAKIGEIAGLQT